MLHTG